jgi:putative proteasome-type protease
VPGLPDAALLVGRLVRDVVAEHGPALGRVGADATTSFILGGQVAGQRPDILLVYPEGNYIRASDDRPFLQIGETKYGKLMLELAVKGRLDMEDATKVAVSSMISTAHANLSVGPPYDLARYRNGSFEIIETRLEAESPILQEIQAAWIAHLLDGVRDLPAIPLEDPAG